jgi:hypothetical protein
MTDGAHDASVAPTWQPSAAVVCLTKLMEKEEVSHARWKGTATVSMLWWHAAAKEEGKGTLAHPGFVGEGASLGRSTATH